MENKACSFGKCIHPVLARGWCSKHYQRWWKYGDPSKVAYAYDSLRGCSVKGCEGKYAAKGFCRIHYERARGGKDPTREVAPRNPAAKATVHPSTIDVAWAAGIYEGEGHVDYSKNNLRACVTQKEEWLLEKLLLLFGGAIYNRNSRSTSAWYLNGARAWGFLTTIYAFLGPRRKKQIDFALRRYWTPRYIASRGIEKVVKTRNGK